MFLIDDLLLAPVKGLNFIARHIHEMVEKELNDESVIKQELLELQMRRELDEISDEEFEEREAELFARLRAAKERQLEATQQVYTADSSVMVVEAGSADEGELPGKAR